MTKTEDHNEQAPGQNKEIIIYVNTKDHQWTKKEISFEELIELAFPGSVKKEFDVTFAKGQSDQEGEIIDGESIHVHPNMEFIVTPTNES